MICTVLINDILIGINPHKDKAREGQVRTCMAHAHNVTNNHRKRNKNLPKRFPRNPVRGATGHNKLMANILSVF